MMINKAYEIMENINDIVSDGNPHQELPNEKELKVQNIEIKHTIQNYY